MKIKRKMFSGYSETTPKAVTYKSAQVMSKYVLDPIDKSMVILSDSPIGKIDSVKRKTDRFSGPVKSWKRYIKYKLEKRKKIDKD